MQAATAPLPMAEAVPPERTRRFVARGVGLAVHEWGDPDGAPLVFTHGFFDHGRGFDLLAPLLAPHYRVIAFDSRGHGRSEWTDTYTWPADIRELIALLDSAGRPVHLVGHSRGGGQATDTAGMVPELVRQLVNIDGFGPPEEGFTPPGRAPREGTLPERFEGHLDRRRRAHERSSWRPYPTFEDLVERRRQQNPRLSREWLRHFLAYSTKETEAGWVWTMDPLLPDGFGPWKPSWIAPFWKHVKAPMLAITGGEPDTWGPLPEDVLAERLAHVPQVERAVIEGAGHFVHMEKPRETAELLLGWLDR